MARRLLDRFLSLIPVVVPSAQENRNRILHRAVSHFNSKDIRVVAGRVKAPIMQADTRRNSAFAPFRESHVYARYNRMRMQITISRARQSDDVIIVVT